MISSSHISFEQLVKLPQVHTYLTAFRRASGLALQLLPANRPLTARSRPRAALEVADLAYAGQPVVRAAGRLRVAIVPLRVAGVHLADWCCGPVVCWSASRAPAGSRANVVASQRTSVETATRIANHWGLTPLSCEQFQAVEKMLRLFSCHVGRLLAGETEPLSLAGQRASPASQPLRIGLRTGRGQTTSPPEATP